MVIQRRKGCTAQSAPHLLVAVFCALSLLAAGCSSDDGLQAGDAATVEQGSAAEISVDGGDWTAVAAGDAVPVDAQVRSADGELRLAFRGGVVRLSPAAVATVTRQRVTLERGEALVSSDGELDAAIEDTEVAGAATYRLASGLASRLGVYDGTVAVRRPAQEREVAALRQLELSPFRLGFGEPLHYSPTDAWDRELLADAIAFDGEAARLSAGMDSSLGTGVRRASYYRQFVSKPAVLNTLAGMAAVSRDRKFGPPSDLLLPLFVAQAVNGTVDAAVDTVSALRADGARWGLIALELDVPSDRVIAAIDAIDERALAADDRGRGAGGSRTRRGDDVRTAAADQPGSSSSTGDSDGSSGTSTDEPPQSAPSDDDPGDPPSGGGTPPGEDPPGGGGNDPKPPKEPEPPIHESVVNQVVKTVGDSGVGEAVGGGNPPDLPSAPELP